MSITNLVGFARISGAKTRCEWFAVALPVATWSELSYALMPNGSYLDYLEDAGYSGRFGVVKESIVQGLVSQGFKAPQGTDPQADPDGWAARGLRRISSKCSSSAPRRGTTWAGRGWERGVAG